MQILSFQSGREDMLPINSIAFFDSFVLYLIELERERGDLLMVFTDIALMERYYGNGFAHMFLEHIERIATLIHD